MHNIHQFYPSLRGFSLRVDIRALLSSLHYVNLVICEDKKEEGTDVVSIHNKKGEFISSKYVYVPEYSRVS